MCEPSPEELGVAGTAVGAPGKAKTELLEPLHDAVSGVPRVARSGDRNSPESPGGLHRPQKLT
jgi:hypothetical protein